MPELNKIFENTLAILNLGNRRQIIVSESREILFKVGESCSK